MNKINKDWKEVKLGDIVYFNPKESLIKGKIYKKVSMDCLKPKTREIIKYELDKFKGGSKFRNGDTLFARITPCLENGKIAQVSFLDNKEIGFGSTEFIVLREKENITLNDYIYYLFITDKIKNIAIKSMTGTSGRQRVQEDVLKYTIVKLPPLAEQKRIASILSALDDKIELNNKTNKILEEMAQTIFKEWFINFNFPNEDGKPYKKSGGEMIDSELGKIPKGWKVITLKDIISIAKGKKPKATSDKITEKFTMPYLTINCYNNEATEYTEYNEKMHVKELDIIMVMDGNAGKIFYGKEGILSSTMAKLIVKDSNLNELVFYFLKSIEYDLMYHTVGSVIQHADKQYMLNKKFCVSLDNLERLSDIFKCIRKEISLNKKENEKLSNIRDSLLPKLMTPNGRRADGEIRI
ncbi:restriction endonuclease subunit S [Brachyspira aalborgi]|uniref:Restriction endonuclease subunit S n=1 Tax=Brachyspira aalborgi TaxID=29522 RepID=A0A5C8G322_9SPIR|nr:restriction endonuclease subunit S [Brachyspira aalborgi]TXJ56225.1 restriction endonuclease subunit S [Brachyspira aalborgi]